MAHGALMRWAARLEADLTGLRRRENPALDRLKADPARLLADAGMPADPWQADLLRRPGQRTLLLCSRQAGKSTVAAALLQPPALVLLLSPSLRQSGELFRDKVMRLFNALGRPVAATQETQLTMTLANGSRVVSLPGEEGTVRGFSDVALLVIDEAARVHDDLYRSVRPMLAVSKGRLVALSTPFGKRGWFFEEWRGTETWQRVRITAKDCPRIDPEFLKSERIALGDVFFDQEYGCVFGDCIASVFRQEDIDAIVSHAPELDELTDQFTTILRR
jgi:hypothetical protein